MEWLIGCLSNKELKDGDGINDNQGGSRQTNLMKLIWYQSDFKGGDLIYSFGAIDRAFHRMLVWPDILIIQLEASSENGG